MRIATLSLPRVNRIRALQTEVPSWIGRLVLTVGLGIIGLELVTLALRLFGVFVIVGPSMLPTLDRVSVVATQPCQVSDLRVGDLVAVRDHPDPPQGWWLVPWYKTQCAFGWVLGRSVKRVSSLRDGGIEVSGDNPNMSKNAQDFGLIKSDVKRVKDVWTYSRWTRGRTKWGMVLNDVMLRSFAGVVYRGRGNLEDAKVVVTQEGDKITLLGAHLSTPVVKSGCVIGVVNNLLYYSASGDVSEVLSVVDIATGKDRARVPITSCLIEGDGAGLEHGIARLVHNRGPLDSSSRETSQGKVRAWGIRQDLSLISDGDLDTGWVSIAGDPESRLEIDFKSPRSVVEVWIWGNDCFHVGKEYGAEVSVDGKTWTIVPSIETVQVNGLKLYHLGIEGEYGYVRTFMRNCLAPIAVHELKAK